MALPKILKGTAALLGLVAVVLLATGLGLDSWRTFSTEIASVKSTYDIGLLYTKWTVEAGGVTREERNEINCDNLVGDTEERCNRTKTGGLSMIIIGGFAALLLVIGVGLAVFGIASQSSFDLAGVGVMILGAILCVVGLGVWGGLTHENYISSTIEYELGTAAALAITACVLSFLAAVAYAIAYAKRDG
uniref:Claudin n=1 Tax=Chromera velia CCMP2878 TaxID=1169474 RepID=A0A0G4EZT1_9ALVE|eukprot:Cvel_14271.t1-p1 / transcript=Cvel_14271.t1 / gene=Cvel_14271 / organism=Chromera_velia_CCMP2878 / gene_product=hypothetical protein / transcript_product=hypothetical protein / location=Cvel_scaffold1007:46641-48885(+) / protein_length=189 / sequence_SO=supercontig / SO=protein_coding / is_pseudo=false